MPRQYIQKNPVTDKCLKEARDTITKLSDQLSVANYRNDASKHEQDSVNQFVADVALDQYRKCVTRS